VLRSSTPAISPELLSDAAPTQGFVDGLGLRHRVTDGADAVDRLHVDDLLAGATGFDFALRERVSRLANFRHAYYGRARRVDRLDGGSLALLSDAVDGARLSHILDVAEASKLDLDVNVALCLLRQIVPAVAMLHQNARDVSHGALAPERIVITPNARVVLVEYVFGAAIESIGFSRERLWKQLRIAVPPAAGTPRLNHRADVMQIGVVALALVLGRPLGDDDVRDLGALVASATENSVMGGREPISDSLRRWLSRALQLDSQGSFESALEAQLALDDVLSGDAGYIAAPVALESFLSQYQEAAAKLAADAGQAAYAAAPEPIAVKVPPPTPKLGVAQVGSDGPAVPSFRAMASDRPSILSVTPKAQAATARTSPEPMAAPVADNDPGTRTVEDVSHALVGGVSAFAGATAGKEAPPAQAALAQALPTGTQATSDNAEPFDDETLRAQFLAASAVAAPPERIGVASWWRLAALVALVIAAAEGGFIAWRLAASPAGLTGTKGTMAIESKPTGAQVKVDGEVKGVTPLTISLDAGAHVVEISAGGEPRVLPVTISAGATLAQYVELSSISALGRVSIQSTPAGASVLLDGQLRGVTPLELSDVSAGDHELVLDFNGHRVRQTVSVAAGATTALVLPIDSPEMATAGMMPGAAPSPVPTTGTVTVQAPFDMEVYEGGTLVGMSGRRLTLQPGSHVLEIVSQTLAFRTEARVEVAAGSHNRVPVKLPKGTVHLNATPWAEVWVDGQKVGETPIGNLSLTIGPHEIVFKHPELGEQAHAATVTAAAPLRLSVDLTKRQ
jgi:hypothetical protein